MGINLYSRIRKITFFPKVFWCIAQKDEEKFSAIYWCDENEIHLFIGHIYHLWWVLIHESFHWLTNIFIYDPDCFNKINILYEKISKMI